MDGTSVARYGLDRLLLALVVSVCGALALASPAQAGDYVTLDSGKPVAHFEWPTRQNWGNNNWGWRVMIPLTDPRGFSSFPLTTAQYQICIDEAHYAGLSSWNMYPNGAVPGVNSTPPGWWPVCATTATGGVWNGADLRTNGTYRLRWYWVDDGQGGLMHDLSVVCYLVDGSWTLEPPGSVTNPQVVDTYVINDPNHPAGLSVYVYRGGVVDQCRVQGATVAASGVFTGSGSTDPNGCVAFGDNLPSGDEVVNVTLPASLGSRSGSTNVHLTAGVHTNVWVNFPLDPNSPADWGGGGGAGGGSGGESGEAPSWLQSAMSALFVPQQSSIDALKTAAGNFASWGPFSVIPQIQGILSAAADPLPDLTVPVPTQTMGAGGVITTTWSSATGTSLLTNPTTQAAAGDSKMVFLRAALGIGVYLGFAFFLIRRLMPTHVV